MKRFILLLALVYCGIHTFAQQVTKQEKGYFNLTEIGYFSVNNNYEVQTSANSYDVTYDGAYAWSLRNINGVFLTNKISVGVGLGLENYTHESDHYDNHNTFQVFADVRYYLKNQNNTFFAYGDLGRSVAISDNIEKGPMYNIGIGYKIKSSQKTALTGSIGFIEQSIKEEAPIVKNRYYGIAFKIGLLL